MKKFRFIPNKTGFQNQSGQGMSRKEILARLESLTNEGANFCVGLASKNRTGTRPSKHRSKK